MDISLLNLVLLVIILILLILFIKSRWDLKSEIRSISETLEAYSRGELDRRLKITREDDLGELAFYFNKLADELAKNLRERYSEREEREKILSQLPQGILVLNSQGLVTLLNAAAYEMLSLEEKGENVFSTLFPAVEALATVGEITSTLKQVFGEYQEPRTV